MFDIHTHILPGVDDGAESLEEALSMLRTLKSRGFNGVFLTPHLNHPTVKTDKEFILRTFEDLKTELEKQLQVYLGSELYLSPNYEEPIPLGDTDLVLVELPTDVYPQYLEETIFDLQLSGYRVILAHVERYRWLAENIPLIEKLRDRNVLFQVNLRALAARAPASPALSRYREAAALLTGDPGASAEEGVAWLRRLARDLAVPPLAAYGVKEADLPEAADKGGRSSSMKGNPVPLTREELLEVLRRSLNDPA